MNVRLWKLLNFPHRLRGWKEEVKHLVGSCGYRSELSAVLIHADGSREDLGVISRRLITDAGAAKVADSFVNTFENEIFNYHAAGTTNTAENVADTTLATEVETRAAGVQTKPSSKVYQTVGTVAFTAVRAVVEHGVFSQLAVGGTLLDRSVFAAINVINGDSIAFTYQLTCPSGG